jgi:RNAse (barnase) inhibitor barstar
VHAIPDGWYAYRHDVHESWQYYQRVAYTIDGNIIHTLDDFYDVIERDMLQGKKWGRNFDALHDILRGNYHNLAKSFTVVWKNVARSKEVLNHQAMAHYYRNRLQSYGGIVPIPVLAEQLRVQYAANVQLDTYEQKRMVLDTLKGYVQLLQNMLRAERGEDQTLFECIIEHFICSPNITLVLA